MGGEAFPKRLYPTSATSDRDSFERALVAALYIKSVFLQVLIPSQLTKPTPSPPLMTKYGEGRPGRLSSYIERGHKRPETRRARNVAQALLDVR